MEGRIFTRFWIIIAAAAGLAALFVVGWLVSLRFSEEEVFENYNRQQAILVRGTAAGIEGTFEDLAAALGSIGALESVRTGDIETAREALVRKQAELSPLGITEIGLLDAEGQALAFAVRQDLAGVDYSWRSFYKQARDSTEPDAVIVEMQPLDSGAMGFRVAVPIRAEADEFLGVVLGELTLDTLIQRYLVPFQPQGGGSIFLVGADSELLWSSDRNQGIEFGLGSSRAELSEMAAGMGDWKGGRAASGAYTYREPGRRWASQLVAYAPVVIGEQVFAVGVYTPGGVARQTALSATQSQSWVFLLSLITLLAGVLVGGLVLRRETRRRLTAEAALRESETEQAILAERNRLAGDLHDSVTQGLYGINLHAGAAIGQLEAGNTQQVREYLGEIKTAGIEALSEMRLLIYELRPPVLAEGGLGAALEARLYAVEKRSGLQVTFMNELERDLPKGVESGLYRIAQEGLNNILKHAQARGVRVRLGEDADGVTLEIQDDGVGFDLEAGRGAGGLGLAGMASRAGELGGELRIETEPGQGTRLFVKLKGGRI